MELTNLSSTELLSTLDTAWTAGNRALARMLAYLGEVERRGLHEELACSSMFAFLERRFGLTGGSAYRRLTAARLVRRFPSILGRIENGDMHLESLCLLREVLTEDNVEELMAVTAKKTLREVEHIIACRAPKPDAKPSIRKLPSGLEQLSQARHKVQLTVSTETRAKVERARDLMKHRNPSGDLEVLFDRAMDALLEKLEKERLGKTSRPQEVVRASKPGHVPAAVRREVFERDGEQCTHVNADKGRCGSRTFLELDHITPRARGGTDEASNLRVVCRTHNRMFAEQVFGKHYIAARVKTRRSEAAPRPSP